MDEERYALTQLVRLAPDEQRYLDRLNLLGGLQEETAEDFAGAGGDRRATSRSLRRLQLSRTRTELAPVAPVTSDEFETNAAPDSYVLRSRRRRLRISTKTNRRQRQLPIFRKSTSASLQLPTRRVAVAKQRPAEEERQENMMRQELESVDFYIAQGYADIAVDTLEMLERQFGPHPEIQSRREKLAQQRSAAAKRRRCLSLAVLKKSRPQRRLRRR